MRISCFKVDVLAWVCVVGEIDKRRSGREAEKRTVSSRVSSLALTMPEVGSFRDMDCRRDGGGMGTKKGRPLLDRSSGVR